MVYQVYEAVSIPIVGMGGVTCARDVIELMLAGATAVEVGAANLTDPFVCQTIIRELPQVMEQYHIESLEESRGGAHQGERCDRGQRFCKPGGDPGLPGPVYR